MPNKFFYILIFLTLFGGVTYADENQDFVKTSTGSVKGYFQNKVINYDDIPYAKPPIGSLRWKAPRELKTPENVIERLENNHCVQEPSSMGGAPGEGILTGEEDCLYLDIKTPKKRSSELLPVMFWIHGSSDPASLRSVE